MSALSRFVVLYALMYAAFGVSSPFMPAFFEARGLVPEQLGILFSAGTAMRLVSGVVGGRLADLPRALRGVLAACELLATFLALALLAASGFAALLMTSLLHAAALAPTTALADALALGAARPRDGSPRFEYDWVRGTGSALFVVGTLVSGQVAASRGLASIVVLQAALLGAAAGAVTLIPEPARRGPAAPALSGDPVGVLTLLRIPQFDG